MTNELKNNVWKGDCLKLMPLLNDKSIDLILADLPYGTTQNKWDTPIDLPGLWKEYKRIIKPGGAIVLMAQGRFTAKLIESNPDWFKYKIVWIKSVATNYLNAKKQPLRRHEDICVFYNKQPVYNPQMSAGKPYVAKRHHKPTDSYGKHQSTTSVNSGVRYPQDVLEYEHQEDHVYINTALSEGSPLYHPTQKPVALGRYLIRTYSNPGDLILDNTCGSGSFLESAIMEGREFIGMEKNEYADQFGKPVDYVAICRKRIRDVLAGTAKLTA